MAFKMKGSAFYGKGNQSPMKATGDPKQEKSESATTNLLGKLGNYEETVSQKSDRDKDLGTVRYSDLPSDRYLRDDEDPILHNPKNKTEIDRREAVAKAEQSEGRTQSMADYIKETSTSEASEARKTREGNEEEAADAAAAKEQQRRNVLGKKGRDKEDKAIEKANKKQDKSALKHVDMTKPADHPHAKQSKTVKAVEGKTAVADSDKAIKTHGGSRTFNSRAEQDAFEKKEKNRKIQKDRDYQYEGKSQLDELKDLGAGDYMRKKLSGRIAGKKYKDWQ